MLNSSYWIITNIIIRKVHIMIELEIFTEYAKAQAICYILMGILIMLTCFVNNKTVRLLQTIAIIVIFYNLPKFVVPKAAAIEMLYKLGVSP